MQQIGNTQSTDVSSPGTEGSSQKSISVKEGFATRPIRSNNTSFGQPVHLYSNMYNLVIKNSPNKSLNKYFINFEPAIPDNA